MKEDVTTTKARLEAKLQKSDEALAGLAKDRAKKEAETEKQKKQSEQYYNEIKLQREKAAQQAKRLCFLPRPMMQKAASSTQAASGRTASKSCAAKRLKQKQASGLRRALSGRTGAAVPGR